MSNILFSQTGVPFIKNFYPEDYQDDAQIWTAVQDSRGVMFFGTNSGILEFDGKNWRKISVAGERAVRSSAKSEDGTIFVGSVGEFGYLKPDKNGILAYKSLTHLLDSASRIFTDVWSVQSIDNNTYFASQEYIFRYNPEKSPQLIKLKTKNKPFLLYTPFNEVLTSISDKGTVKISEDSIVSVKGIETEYPWFILPYKKHSYILGSGKKGLYIFNPKNADIDNITGFNKK